MGIAICLQVFYVGGCGVFRLASQNQGIPDLFGRVPLGADQHHAEDGGHAVRGHHDVVAHSIVVFHVEVQSLVEEVGAVGEAEHCARIVEAFMRGQEGLRGRGGDVSDDRANDDAHDHRDEHADPD